jgi:hypothetical protein
MRTQVCTDVCTHIIVHAELGRVVYIYIYMPYMTA